MEFSEMSSRGFLLMIICFSSSAFAKSNLPMSICHGAIHPDCGTIRMSTENKKEMFELQVEKANRQKTLPIKNAVDQKKVGAAFDKVSSAMKELSEGKHRVTSLRYGGCTDPVLLKTPDFAYQACPEVLNRVSKNSFRAYQELISKQY